MNNPKTSQHLRRKISALAVITGLSVGVLFVSPKAHADYGHGGVYQIELSGGDLNSEHGAGGGYWLWFALYPDGTGDYAGSDCILAGRFGLQGSYGDRGDVTWTDSGGSIVISNVVFNGFRAISNLLGGCPVQCDPTQLYACPPYTGTTVTVPAAYGHYTGTVGTFITVPQMLVNCVETDAFDPNGGSSQLQVAP